jgi:DNA end-binding protein Ku
MTANGSGWFSSHHAGAPGDGLCGSLLAVTEPATSPRKAAAGQKAMLLPIAGKKPVKETAEKKAAGRPQRKSA